MSQWTKVGNIMGPPGQAGGTVYVLVTGEIPSGLINGVNTIFTASANFHASSLQVYLNGLRTQELTEWTIPTGVFNQFQMTYPPMTGDTIQIDYIEL